MAKKRGSGLSLPRTGARSITKTSRSGGNRTLTKVTRGTPAVTRTVVRGNVGASPGARPYRRTRVTRTRKK